MGKSRSELRIERLALYGEYKSSSQSVSEFSKLKGIPEWKVRHCIKIARKVERSESGFQELLLPSISGSGYSVIFHNGHELKLPHNFTEQKVCQLIGLLSKC